MPTGGTPPRLDMMIDEVDSRDHVVGKTVRRQLGVTPTNFRVVHVMVWNDDGELLLQQVAQGLRSAGLWGSSAAGYLQAGEDYEHAARRKILEELGLASDVTFCGKTRMNDLAAEKFIGIYTAHSNGPFSPSPDDVASLEFLKPAQIDHDRAGGQRRFTPTFLHVFDFLRSIRKLP